MAKIIVTGATSFIGVPLINGLLKNHNEVVAVVRPHSKNLSRLKIQTGLTVIACPLTNMDMLPELIGGQADIFYHLAWDGTRVPQRDDENLQHHNYIAALAAFQAAGKLGCQKFVGVGSQAEYGRTKGIVTEDYPALPLTEYGKAKLRAHKEIEALGRQTGIKVVWPRIFSLYGSFDFSGTLIMSALQKMLQNQELAMTAGTQNWNYLFVNDAAKMLTLLGTNDCASGTYNLASLDNRPLKNYIEEMKMIVQSDSHLNFGAIPYGKEGQVSFVASVAKFQKNFPDFKFTTFAQGVRQLMEVIKE